MQALANGELTESSADEWPAGLAFLSARCHRKLAAEGTSYRDIIEQSASGCPALPSRSSDR